MAKINLQRELDEIFKAAESAHRQDYHAVVIELIEPYLQNRPKHEYAWAIYGMALDHTLHFKKAEAALLKAIELYEPFKRFVAQTSLALLYHRWGLFDKSEEVFAKACRSKFGKKSGYIWILRGSNYLKLEKIELAKRCFEASLVMKFTDKDEAYLNLGAAFVMERKYRDAISAYKKALKVNPKYKQAKAALRSLENIPVAIKKANAIR